MSGDWLFRYSIRGRAALLTSVLVAVALAAFTWVTVARVRADLITRGIERAETTAATLATQTSQNTQQGLNRLERLAEGPAVRDFLRRPGEDTRAAVIAGAQNLSTSALEETLSIWDGNRRVLDVPLGTEPRTIPP